MRLVWPASCALFVAVASWCGCFLNTAGTPSSTGSGGGSSGTSTGGGGTGGGTGGTGAGTLCSPGATEACYTGPMGTEMIGQCKPGIKTCKSDGAGYGPCIGEVKPTPENCVLASDQNCNGATTLCTGTALWSKAYGSTDFDEANGVAVDFQRNVLITGAFRGTVDFGGGPFTAVGSDSVFVVKYSPVGGLLWRKQLSATTSAVGYAITTDATGNSFICGDFEGDITLDGVVLGAGKHDVFVVKLDPAGNVVWGKTFGDDQEQHCSAIAADSAGDVVFAGDLRGALQVGPKTITTQANGDQDAFVAKLSAGGNGSWVIQIKGANNDIEHVAALAIDGAKNVILAGAAEGDVTLDTIQVTGHGAGYDALVGKISPGGVAQWGKLFGDGTANQFAFDVATTGIAGDFVVTGAFDGTITFDTPYPTAGASDVFLVQLDPSGTTVRSKAFGGTGNERPRSIAIDSFGNIAIAGDYDQALSFGGFALTPANVTDVFVARLDPFCAPLWAKSFGAVGNDVALAVAVDPLGGAVIAGSFEGTVVFGPNTHVSVGKLDSFVAKLDP